MLGVSQATENIIVNKIGMTFVFLELTVCLSMIRVTGGSACLQLQESGYRMTVYLWDLNVDFINWQLAPETQDSACSTWDLLTRLIVNRTNY